MIALADLGKFRAAAELLKVSHPTLTRLIQRAEDEFGAKVFDRTSRKVRVTTIGREVIARCRILASEVEDFERYIDRIRTSGGMLLIACGHLAARTILQPALLKLLESLPDIRARIEVKANKDPLKGLLDRSIDVFIGDLTHTPEFAGIDVQLFRRYEIVVAARSAHPVHQDGPQPLGNVLRYPFVLAHLHNFWRKVFRQALTDQQVPKPDYEAGMIPRIECDDLALTGSLVADSGFLTAGLRESFAEYLEAGTLREVQLTTPLVWDACIARRSGSDDRGIDAFWRILLAHKSN